MSASLLDRIPLYALCTLVVVVPLFVWPRIDIRFGKTLLLALGSTLILSLWAVVRLRRRTGFIRCPWVLLGGIALAAAGALSVLGSAQSVATLHSVIILAVYLQLLFLISNLVTSRRDANLLMISWGLSAVLVGGYALLQYVGVLPGTAGETPASQMVASIGNVNGVGAFLAYALVPGILLFLSHRGASGTIPRVVLLVVLLFLGGVSLVVRQAGVFLAVGAGVATYVLLATLTSGKARARLQALLVVGMVLVLGTGLFIGAQLISSSRGGSGERLGERLWTANSLDVRVLSWDIAARLFSDHPALGVGLGGYGQHYIEYKADYADAPRPGPFAEIRSARGDEAHNDYLQWAAETGVPGILTLFIAIATLALTVRQRLQRAKSPEDRRRVLILTSGGIAICAHALVDFPFHVPTSAFAFLILLGTLSSRAEGKGAALSFPTRHRLSPLLFLGLLVSSGGLATVVSFDLASELALRAGVAHLHHNRLSAAQTALERADQISLSTGNAPYYLATTQARLGAYDDALHHFERALDESPTEHAYLFYADLASQLGRLESATEAIDTLVDFNPKGEMWSRARHVQAKIAVLRQRPDEALEQLETLLAADPTFTRARILMGDLLREAGRWNEARNAYERALETLNKRIEQIQADLAPGRTLEASRHEELTAELGQLRTERNQALDALARLSAG